MRAIVQPGAPLQPRAVVVPCRAVPIDAELAAGRPLLDALHELVATHRADSASLVLSGGRLDPFGYVMPALSPDAAHAAWYSAPQHPPGGAWWEEGAVTVGFRDGAPFFHCHGLWRQADGTRHGGHVLPDHAVIAAPMRAVGAGVVGARFVVADDPETGFRLFGPVATDRPGGQGALAVRLRPNQDVTQALAASAAAAGIDGAQLVAGVGSIIGAAFDDAAAVEPFATELYLSAGALARPLRAGLVDLTGTIAAGTLTNGDNPVLMTLEAVLTAA
jgi:hypothetical protein